MRFGGLAITICVATLITPLQSSLSQGQTVRQNLPNPILVFTGTEEYEASGKKWVRYKYSVYNSSAYPDELFAASPDLPPCGRNRSASRTWIDFYEQDGKRLYGFCAIGKSEDLDHLWFALEPGSIPPSWIYIEMTDRKANLKYKSNLAETTL